MKSWYIDSNQLLLWPDKRTIDTTAGIVKRVGPKKGLTPFDKATYKNIPLVLASASVSKCNILRSLGLRVIIDPANIDEVIEQGLQPEEIVQSLAKQKSQSVAIRHPGAIVIGADTLVHKDGNMIGKPRNRNHARDILNDLSGSTHSILTGLSLVDPATKKPSTRVCCTKVTFRELSNQTVERYLQTGEPMGKAGGYALQGMGALLIEKINGEYSNVLGLPIQTLVDGLGDIGYELI